MWNLFTIKRLIVATLVVGVLGGSHWLVYRLGARHQKQRTALLVESIVEGAENNALSLRVQALRIMAKHTAHIPAKDVLSFCRMTDLLADSVEKTTVRPQRDAGNDPAADRWQAQVDEARKFSALLKRERW